MLEFKKRYDYLISFNIDDPYGGRDGRRWRLFLKSLPLYDLVVTISDCNVSEAMNEFVIEEILRKSGHCHKAAEEVETVS